MAEQESRNLRYLDVEIPEGRNAEFSPEEHHILDAINRKVAAAESLDEAMDFLFDSTREICPCDRLGLAFLEDGNQRVVAHWARALYEPLLLPKGFSQDLRGSSLEAVLDSGRPRIINDLKKYFEEHPSSGSTKLIVREGVRSSMTCPLIVEGRAVGFLFRSSRKRNAYDRHHVRLHQAVAERLSQAVEKAYRIEQLTAANRAYFEMLGFVSHELRSPLASIVMNIETFQAGYLGPLEDRQEEKLGRMKAKAQYLLGLVEEYMNLARVESGRLDLNPREDVDIVNEVVGRSLEIVGSLIEEKRMTLRREMPDGEVRSWGDPGLLVIALVNLLGNAAKYGNEGGEIRLWVEPGAAVLRIRVRNTGPGFPPDQRARLFRKFSRLPSPELMKRKGTGIGLYTTWRIVQQHGGRIWADSEPGLWAEFGFEIPRRFAEGIAQREVSTP